MIDIDIELMSLKAVYNFIEMAFYHYDRGMDLVSFLSENKADIKEEIERLEGKILNDASN
jgi:hypothetical protein